MLQKNMLLSFRLGDVMESLDPILMDVLGEHSDQWTEVKGAIGYIDMVNDILNGKTISLPGGYILIN